MDIPLKDANRKWKVMTVQLLKFLVDGKTCQSVKKPVRIATNGTDIRELSDTPKLCNLDIYMLPRHNSQSRLSACVAKLLTASDVLEISSVCKLLCTDTVHSTVELLESNKYSILNPAAEIVIVCANKLVPKVQKISTGRIELFVPCHCSVQETPGFTIISP